MSSFRGLVSVWILCALTVTSACNFRRKAISIDYDPHKTHPSVSLQIPALTDLQPLVGWNEEGEDDDNAETYWQIYRGEDVSGELTYTLFPDPTQSPWVQQLCTRAKAGLIRFLTQYGLCQSGVSSSIPGKGYVSASLESLFLLADRLERNTCFRTASTTVPGTSKKLFQVDPQPAPVHILAVCQKFPMETSKRLNDLCEFERERCTKEGTKINCHSAQKALSEDEALALSRLLNDFFRTPQDCRKQLMGNAP